MGKKKAEAKAGAKFPKQFAGVKIPKALRDTGDAAMKLAGNPAARELLTAGLVAAAAAVAANSRARKVVADNDSLDEAIKADLVADDGVGKIGTALLGAVGVMAERFLSEQQGARESAKPMRSPAPLNAANASSSSEKGAISPAEAELTEADKAPQEAEVAKKVRANGAVSAGVKAVRAVKPRAVADKPAV